MYQGMAFNSPKDVREAFVHAFTDVVNDALRQRGACSIALTAGSALAVLDALPDAQIDWSKVHVFWADERCTEPGTQRTNAERMSALLSSAGVPQANIHSVNSHAGPDIAAATYEAELRGQPEKLLPLDDEGMPQFDVVVLGLGSDGSIASLWPNSKQIAEERSVVMAVEQAPEEPKQRVTLTMKAINAAKRIMLPVVGAHMAELVQRVLEIQALPGAQPAQMLSPQESALWLLDSEAASQLSMSQWGEKKAFPRNQPPQQTSNGTNSELYEASESSAEGASA